jgi:hypothetical protein
MALLLRIGLLSFVNPFASHGTSDSQLDLAVMLPEVTRSYLVLICILLPIATELRRLKGQHIPFRSTHLFILLQRHTNTEMKWHYNANDVNGR